MCNVSFNSPLVKRLHMLYYSKLTSCFVLSMSGAYPCNVQRVWICQWASSCANWSLALKSRSLYLHHNCLHAWLDLSRCDRRRPWSLTDSCMSHSHGYHQSTACGERNNENKASFETQVCVSELFSHCSPFLCHSRDAEILQYRVYSLDHRNLYNTLPPVKHIHT